MEKDHNGDLVGLAKLKFRDLSLAEVSVLRAAPEGEIAYCGPSKFENDPRNDPATAEKEWGPQRQVRAALIRWLCLDKAARELVDVQGHQDSRGQNRWWP